MATCCFDKPCRIYPGSTERTLKVWLCLTTHTVVPHNPSGYSLRIAAFYTFADMNLTKEPTVHLGHRVERLREIVGMKQEALATALGVSQQAVSKMEQSEKIDEERLQKVADALGVSVEAIRNFSEEALFNNINNTFHDHSALVNYQFNPIEKVVELYERLLKSEQEKVAMLQALLDRQKGL